MEYKTHSWGEILQFYSDFPLLPMFQLVKEIAESRYAYGVFPIISLKTLILAQTAESDLTRNTIRVDYLEDHFLFSYSESANSRNRWEKRCDRANGFSTFEHVMKTLKWFHTI